MKLSNRATPLITRPEKGMEKLAISTALAARRQIWLNYLLEYLNGAIPSLTSITILHPLSLNIVQGSLFDKFLGDC
jgi:hypothetical protein